MKLYKIKDWNEHFESNDSRKREALNWVRMPNKMDGLGYRRITAEAEKCELFAAWCLILQVASKGSKNERGTLIREGSPLTPADLAIITGFPEKIFSRALNFFEKVGWILSEDWADPSNPAATDTESLPENGAAPLGKRSKKCRSMPTNADTSAESGSREMPINADEAANDDHEMPKDTHEMPPSREKTVPRIRDRYRIPPIIPPDRGDGVSDNENDIGEFLRVVRLVNPEGATPRPQDELDAWAKRTYEPTPDDLEALEALYASPKAVNADETWTRKRNVFLLIDGLQRCAEEARAWAARHRRKEKRPSEDIPPEPDNWRATLSAIYPEAPAPSSWAYLCVMHPDIAKQVSDTTTANGRDQQ